MVLVSYLEKQRSGLFKLEEDEDTDYRHSKNHWKRQENNKENTLDLQPKAITDGKNKRKNKATCDVVEDDDDDDDDEEMKKNHQRKKRNVYIENRVLNLLKHRQ